MREEVGPVAGLVAGERPDSLAGSHTPSMSSPQDQCRPAALQPVALSAEAAGQLFGGRAGGAAVPAPPLPTRHRVLPRVDDGVEHAVPLGHHVRPGRPLSLSSSRKRYGTYPPHAGL